MKAKGMLGILVVLFGCALVFYSPLLFGSAGLVDDQLFYSYPGCSYLASALADGRLPLWLSGQRSGLPFHGDVGMTCYYPPSWLLSLVVTNGILSARAYSWYLVLHLALAGVFMTVFLGGLGLDRRMRLLGGIVFLFSAFLSLHFVHTGAYQALAWMPLQLYFLRRMLDGKTAVSSGCAFALVTALAFLAGFPQVFMYMVWFALAYWVYLLANRRAILNLEGEPGGWRGVLRSAGRLPLALLLGLALGAVQILPAAENWSNSHRQQFGFEQISDLSLPWYYLVHGLVPNFFGASNGDGSGVAFWGFNHDTKEFRTWHGGAWMYWDFGFYAGQLALIAMAVMVFNVRRLWRERREIVFFLAALPLVVWLMLGRYGGLFTLFYHVVPGFSMFRSPARIGCLFDFSAAVLAAVLVDAVWRRKPDFELKRPLWVVGGTYAVLFFGFLIYGSSFFPELNEPRLFQHALAQVGISVVTVVLTAALLLWLKRLSEKPVGRGVLPGGRTGWTVQAVVWALIALSFLDLYLAFHKFHQGRVNPQEYYADRNGLIAQMKTWREKQGPFRFAQLRDGKISEEIVFPRNIGFVQPGYEALEGYVLFNLKEQGTFNNITNERVRLDIQNVGVMANLDSRSRQVGLIRYTNSLPRVKFYSALRAYPDTQAVYADLDGGRLDYRREAGVLAEDCSRLGLSTSAPPANASASVTFTPVSPEEYRIEYRTTTPGIIFVSETYYPGWLANGGALPIIKTFGAFKGIVVREAGQGVITVKYSPWTLKVGLSVTLVALAALAGVWIGTGRRRRVEATT